MMMTHRRAIWEALAMVVLPTSFVWGFFLYKFGFYWEEWPVYAIFAFLPMALLVPLSYRRIMDGPVKRGLSRRQHIIWAVMLACFTTLYLALAPWHNRDVWDRAFQIGLALLWFADAANHARKALQSNNTASVAAQ
jgi:predicted CDP-diglyceride synthetase/phosphatidate cytidylyltransferase